MAFSAESAGFLRDLDHFAAFLNERFFFLSNATNHILFAGSGLNN